MTPQSWIAVGIDGSAGARAATGWAAAEARRLGIGVRLVNVDPSIRSIGTFARAGYPPVDVDGPATQERLLRAAVQQASAYLPAARIEARGLRADVRAGLVEAAADARLLVLGAESQPPLTRIVTGSVVGPVAAHSAAPVVVVPDDWADDPEHRTVVVGVKSAASAEHLVRQAFHLAAGHGGKVVLVHAWELLSPSDDLIAAHADFSDWEERALADLRDLLARTAHDFPGTEAEARLVRGQPAKVLVDASESARLLMLSRLPRWFPQGRLGATGRAVLRESRCPTMVLPPTAEAVDVDLSLEAAGRAQFGAAGITS